MAFIEVRNIEKHYKEIKAVKGISFDIEKGKVIGLLGPNGAGKSTTISMISTLLKPDKGEVFFEGESILKNPIKIQKKLGIVPQEIALYESLSAYDNLEFWGSAYGLKKAKLKERIKEVAKLIGLEDRLKKPVKSFSGGMKRRLNIGVALLHEPELLIMDEPTVGIDPQSRNHILDTVVKLNEKGMTIIYTSHYMEEVEKLCDKIYIMDEGEIVADGDIDQLVNLVPKNKVFKIGFNQINDDLINSVKNIDGVEDVKIKDGILIIDTNRSEKMINELVDIASLYKLSIESVDIQRVNLETVFLHLTGKALRDE
jgi:ABC-2 type transport system ATP-binding protein